jgi:diguanylate cyclase (GGDEF)-like protein
LQATAAQLRAAARAEESVCRLGGEEFVVMCEGADRGGAYRAGERLREAVAARPVRYSGGEYTVTVSVGVAVREPLMTHPDHLLKAADQAVYAAKQAGRNRTCLYPPVEPQNGPGEPAA